MFSGGELSCRDSGQMSRQKTGEHHPPRFLRVVRHSLSGRPRRSRAVRAHTNRALLKGTERTGSLGCLKA